MFQAAKNQHGRKIIQLSDCIQRTFKLMNDIKYNLGEIRNKKNRNNTTKSENVKQLAVNPNDFYYRIIFDTVFINGPIAQEYMKQLLLENKV